MAAKPEILFNGRNSWTFCGHTYFDYSHAVIARKQSVFFDTPLPLAHVDYGAVFSDVEDIEAVGTDFYNILYYRRSGSNQINTVTAYPKYWAVGAWNRKNLLLKGKTCGNHFLADNFDRMNTIEEFQLLLAKNDTDVLISF